MSTKHEHIADTLTEEVLSGRYQPGDRLPSERELAVRFDANRGAVREAMTKLAQLGIADIQPGGARVAPIAEASLDIIGCMLARNEVPDANLMHQILEVVDRLLIMAAENTVDRATDEQIDEIRKLVQVLCNDPLGREAHAEARRISESSRCARLRRCSSSRAPCTRTISAERATIIGRS